MKNNPWYYKLDGVLVKKMKPFLPDNYIHVKRWEGCYRVYDVTLTHFSIMKNREKVWLTWDEFECLKGEGKSIISEAKRELKSIRTSLLFDVYRIDNIINKIKFAY
jgi:hypothetical protein